MATEIYRMKKYTCDVCGREEAEKEHPNIFWSGPSFGYNIRTIRGDDYGLCDDCARRYDDFVDDFLNKESED